MNFEALFLGPQAENHRFLKEMVSFFLDEHIHWRRNFHPDDTPSITLSDQSQADFIAMQQKTQEVLLQLSSKLKQSSLPWHSPRYLSHMTSDILLPAHLAYILTMLYNPNNVAWEGSPVTTSLELQVGLQLARLLGFDEDQAFGHITSGGTIANNEALWFARNLKSIPLAVKRVRPDLVADIADKTLMNLSVRDTLALLSHSREQMEETKQASIRGSGLKSCEVGRVFVPRTRHYSWDKIVDVLGIGTDNLVRVNVTDDFRMDIMDLRTKIEATVSEGSPVLAVIGVVGTTEEGAVDPVHEIVALREQFEAQGVSFYIHIDAAYGGYARALFLDEDSGFMKPDELLKTLHRKHIISDSYQYPSHQIYRAFEAIKDVDSVTIDPHKLGYVPYQAGAVVFRDKRIRNIISYFAPYVFEEGNEYQNPLLLGSYIMEGSKSGAAAAAVWAAHQVVGLNNDGYGRIIGETIEGALRLHSMMVEKERIRAGHKLFRIAPLTRPDTNIVVYAFNEDGNTSLARMNDLNRSMKERLYYEPGKRTHQYEFMVSSTLLSRDEYGDGPLDFLHRLGIPSGEWAKEGEVFVLRSTIMSPYLTSDFTHLDYAGMLFGCFERVLGEVSGPD